MSNITQLIQSLPSLELGVSPQLLLQFISTRYPHIPLPKTFTTKLHVPSPYPIGSIRHRILEKRIHIFMLRMKPTFTVTVG